MLAVRHRMIVLITGPVRSGKSTRALQFARGLGPVTHVVTARVDPRDREMADRIARHRGERGSEPAIELWQPGGGMLEAIVAAAPEQTALLIDSLGTWLAGHLLDREALAETDPAATVAQLEALKRAVAAALAQTRANVVIVGEETGWGLVPPSAQGRIFRDVLGRLDAKRIGRLAERVELVVAGYALDLRSYGIKGHRRAPRDRRLVRLRCRRRRSKRRLQAHDAGVAGFRGIAGRHQIVLVSVA